MHGDGQLCALHLHVVRADPQIGSRPVGHALLRQLELQHCGGVRGKCEVEAGAAFKARHPGRDIFQRIGFRVAARTLRNLPLARIDLPSGHSRHHGSGIQVVHDDLQMIQRGHRNENA